MKLHLLSAIGLMVGFAVPALAQEKIGNCVGPQDACQQLAQFVRDYESFYNRHDATAVATLYTLDAVNVQPGLTLHGRQARLADGITAGFSNLTVHADEAYVVGDLAWWYGEWTLTGPGPKKTARPYQGSWTDVTVRDGGTWKHRLESGNETPPQQAEASSSISK